MYYAPVVWVLCRCNNTDIKNKSLKLYLLSDCWQLLEFISLLSKLGVFIQRDLKILLAFLVTSSRNYLMKLYPLINFYKFLNFFKSHFFTAW